MVKVKICGITNLEDALAAADSRADALGFVFYRKSPRYISPLEARRIIKVLPARIKKVGVFVNAKTQTIKSIAGSCDLDILQFHGKESPEFCRGFSGYKVVKAFRLKDAIDPEQILRYKTFGYLFDTFIPGKPGGTGRRFNWNLLSKLDKMKQQIFLSGGLRACGIKDALKITRADWVDVSSSVETRPGKKDRRKVKEFIRAAKR
ncbi:MAG: phosphoribosylanthranilate isomerase [Candidatus Omnitrophica bacterium]|nr:phosphoribosylanthranilate isomerase [Candidatus Omnitrophota bacterium]